MDPYRKNLSRLAVAMHNAFSRSQTELPINLRLPEDSWEHCRDLWRQIDLAKNRGWLLAAAFLQAEFKSALERLGFDAYRCEQAINTSPRQRLASPREIFADLLSLTDEFGGFEFELQAGTLSVTTDPIELDGFALGTFTIELTWRNFNPSERAYRITANDPHPATSDRDVVHPHVSDGDLCEGDAKRPIQAALAQGRIGDFFLIVKQLLHTYNASSAYVQLENWEGSKCSECSDSMPADQLWECEACGGSICDDCRRICEGCESTHCSDCIKKCDECNCDTCRHCLHRCSQCSDDLCRECLQETHTHKERDEATTTNTPPPEPATIHAVCLGETPLPS